MDTVHTHKPQFAVTLAAIYPGFPKKEYPFIEMVKMAVGAADKMGPISYG